MNMHQVTERFLRYVKIDTQSDENSDSCPSTIKQKKFAGFLKDEMMTIGFKDVSLDDNGYLMGTVPSNTPKEIPVIGFLAHMDTSPDMTGEKVNPVITQNYNGGDILLNKSKKVILSPKEFPELLDYSGQDIITTDGTTLLGADDKAGIAEIMTAMEHLLRYPEIIHGKIRVAFTPDEEIGRGADKFDVSAFGAEFAYTIDGGQLGELEFENFNAALATIKVHGRNVHPGTAKNQMLNSIHMANEFINMLPVSQRPEYTEGYEGFFHLYDFKGSVEETILKLLIRDHYDEKFDQKKTIIKDAVAFQNKKFGAKRFSLTIKDQYNNMRKMIEPRYDIIRYAEKAMISCVITPIIKPVRGGTDGARLSFMGLPCPNIFAGGHNFHGKFEFIPIQSMKKAVDVIINIAKNVSDID
jgi:tripeptide aminopeptidase